MHCFALHISMSVCFGKWDFSFTEVRNHFILIDIYLYRVSQCSVISQQVKPLFWNCIPHQHHRYLPGTSEQSDECAADEGIATGSIVANIPACYRTVDCVLKFSLQINLQRNSAISCLSEFHIPPSYDLCVGRPNKPNDSWEPDVQRDTINELNLLNRRFLLKKQLHFLGTVYMRISDISFSLKNDITS
jgi:hypothetical protein